MPKQVSTTPLIALEAVVLDTETTGLDVKSDRLLQIGAIRMVGDRLDPDNMFEQLVNPGMAIPEASTEIHGITDAVVADAPDAGAALAALEDFLSGSVVIGHTIGFDTEIMSHEARRVERPWAAPRALDIRLLAQVVAPNRTEFDLDALCEALGIEIVGRHTAIGDAVATAKVYQALLPDLRRKGVRTVADAEAACRRLDDGAFAQTGRMPVFRKTTRDEEVEPAARIDSYPYTHRVRDVMSAPPAVLTSDASIADAVDLLMERGISSVFVTAPGGRTGIVTERDVLRALHTRKADALAVRLGEVRNLPLQTVSADAFVYRAIGRMDRLGIRHLGVTGADGEIVGAVTTRNLLRHRAGSAMVLGDALRSAPDVPAMAETWSGVVSAVQQLVEEAVDPLLISGVISSEIRMLTKRAAEIGEARMAHAGNGKPPVPYAVLVLGSAGRGESLLAADQDNAIVYNSGDPDGPEDEWFALLGGHIADILDEVGIPYCKGGVMARNHSWRKSRDEWIKTIDGWIEAGTPDALLNVDIFFDAVPVHGLRKLGDALRDRAYAHGSTARAFRQALLHQQTQPRSPIGFFGGLRKDGDGRVDLKMTGLLPIVTAGRVVAIRNGDPRLATPERLRGAAEAGVASPDQVEGLVAAQRTIMGAMLKQQIDDALKGVPLGPRVAPGLLGKRAQEDLKTALADAGAALDLAREGML